MIAHAFRAMGTDWTVDAPHPDDGPSAEALVRDVEARLSRFRPDSALSRLHRDREAVDPVLADVVRAALALREATSGAFDPTVGAAVLAAGYTASFDRLPLLVAPPDVRDERPDVLVDGDRVVLRGPGLLDLGGIAKGWTVDRVAERLSGDHVVDGGGDLRVGGEHAIGLPGDRAVVLRDRAVATSSSLRRRWRTLDGDAHHIVRPRDGRPSGRVTTAVVVARDATTADALATALVADPELAAPALARLGAEALVDDGAWWMTPGMEAWLC